MQRHDGIITGRGLRATLWTSSSTRPLLLSGRAGHLGCDAANPSCGDNRQGSGLALTCHSRRLLATGRPSCQGPSFKSRKRSPKPKCARTAPKNFLNNSRALPNKTRLLGQLAPENSPESSACSLSHRFFGVPCTHFEIPLEDFFRSRKSRIRYRFVIHAEILGSGIRN